MSDFELIPDALVAAGRCLVHQAHGASVHAGWWTDHATYLDLVEVVRNPDGEHEKLLAGALVAQKIALIHSEISEALEGYRKNERDQHLPHRPAIVVELADAFIRAADLCGALGLDLGGAIAEKMVFNASRPDHQIAHRMTAHGKKF